MTEFMAVEASKTAAISVGTAATTVVAATAPAIGLAFSVQVAIGVAAIGAITGGGIAGRFEPAVEQQAGVGERRADGAGLPPRRGRRRDAQPLAPTVRGTPRLRQRPDLDGHRQNDGPHRERWDGP